jgi:hypothetical protein
MVSLADRLGQETTYHWEAREVHPDVTDDRPAEEVICTQSFDSPEAALVDAEQDLASALLDC